jgi:RNA polymerase sigma factor (sigma-70 family)
MLNIDEAQQLMERLIELRTQAHKSELPEDIRAFRQQEAMCVEKFTYLVTMKTSRYRNFSNYDDLNQEGIEALLKGMKNYNPKKGCAFWWFHRYIDTRISRSANLHTTIRYPLKIAKATPPHKELNMPVIIEEKNCPDQELETLQNKQAIKQVLTYLPALQQEVISLAYGFDGDKPVSINRICKKMGISRNVCLKMIDEALLTMREHIKI